jgi:hypothetical protein
METATIKKGLTFGPACAAALPGHPVGREQIHPQRLWLRRHLLPYLGPRDCRVCGGSGIEGGNQPN